MQDRVKIHTAKIIIEFFEVNKIQLLEHPAYSPDLNPIEHLWRKLKNLVFTMHPELTHMTSKDEEAFDLLIRAIIEAWEAIPQSFFDAVVDSMQARWQAVITAQGWQTRY
jgi:hypothetical protein